MGICLGVSPGWLYSEAVAAPVKIITKSVNRVYFVEILP